MVQKILQIMLDVEKFSSTQKLALFLCLVFESY